MPRPLMFVPEPWTPFELTMRCAQSRLLLKPGDEANRRVLGVLGRAMELFDGRVRLYFAGGTSNHLHIIAAFDTAETKARWKSHVKCNISKELGALFDWPGGHWDRRTRDIPILDDDALRQRLMYLGRHAMKDGLVRTADCWPGIQWVRAVTDGRPLRGVWYDRTRLDALRRAWSRQPPASRGPRPGLGDVAVWKTLVLTPPPMWSGLDAETLRARWVTLFEAAEARYPTPSTVLGREAVLEADPHARPLRSKRSPAPQVHATSRQAREAWAEAYAAFVEAYRAALDQLALGCAAVFPAEGCRPACVLGAAGAGGG